MAIRDWKDDYRVLVLNQEISTNKEVDVGKEQTPTRDKMAPKKPNPGQNPSQQKKGGASKKDTQEGKKNNTEVSPKQEKYIETTQGTT
jgi:hypothetical protein